MKDNTRTPTAGRRTATAAAAGRPRTHSRPGRRRLLGALLAAGALVVASVIGTMGQSDGAAAETTAQEYPNPGLVTGDTGVHDPTFVKRPDGSYLVAHTGDDITLKTSPDRTAFSNAGTAFPDGAPWTSEYTGGSRQLWAPDLSYHDGVYHMYYAASTFGSSHSAIFLATSTSGDAGTWTDQGLVVESQSSDDFNAIDPNLVVDDEGRWWLSYGSYWSGLKLVEVDPATGKPAAGATVHPIAARGGDHAIEAPTIAKHGDYYYLYASFDRCCQGASSTYRVMVGRSTDVTGPYLDRNGTPMTDGGGTEILAGHGSFHGTGHQDVFTDTDSDILAYHYYADDGNPLLGINLLAYDPEGWPYVH